MWIGHVMRAFVAIELPEPLRQTLSSEQARFRAICPDARWTQPEGIHLTLKFLGEISDQQIASVKEALRKLGPFERFTVQAKGFGFFPDARRPRVFWVGVDAPPALVGLAASVEDALLPLGFPPENQSFNPHLTLARFKIPRPQPQLQALLAEQGNVTPGAFTVSEFFLWESKLSPRGSEYHKIDRFP